MKEYFKYANGFVNINDENLFLTNSGNWSETHELLEKSPKSIKQNNFKGFKIYIFLFVVVCLVVLIVSKSKSGSIPFGIILLGLGAFAYLKRETGKRYKIPIAKIRSIEIIENSAKIIFLNENNAEDLEAIKVVETKGLGILEDLKHQIKDNLVL
jgi:hypothetical protein